MPPLIILKSRRYLPVTHRRAFARCSAMEGGCVGEPHGFSCWSLRDKLAGVIDSGGLHLFSASNAALSVSSLFGWREGRIWGGGSLRSGISHRPRSRGVSSPRSLALSIVAGDVSSARLVERDLAGLRQVRVRFGAAGRHCPAGLLDDIAAAICAGNVQLGHDFGRGGIAPGRRCGDGRSALDIGSFLGAAVTQSPR